jgi:hypothetical protein
MSRLFVILFCICIFSTLAGGIGGSFQPARILLAGMACIAIFVSPRSQSNFNLLRQIFTLTLFIIIFGIISLAWTPDLIGGIGMLLAVGVGSSAIYSISRADLSVDSVNLMVWSWLGVVALSVIIAFYEIVTGNHFQFSLDARVIGGNFGTFPFASIFFGNYNDYSTWLCLAFPFTLAAFLQARNNATRSLVMFINLALISIIFVNTSRMALIYVSVALSVYTVIFQRFRLYSFVASLIVIPSVFVRYSGDILNLYDLAVDRFINLNLADESLSQRLGLLQAGSSAVKESWGLGIGIGGFEEYINQNYPYYIPNPHNIFMEIAVNFGLPSALLFAAVLALLFVAGLQRKDLPVGFRLILMQGSLSVPFIGAVPSQAIGYVYWWVWLATMVAIAALPRAQAPTKL